MKNTPYMAIEATENTSLTTNNTSVKPSDFVSRRFYAYIMDRVADACRLVADTGNLQTGTKKLIDNYICKGTIGSEGKGSQPLITPEMMLIFTILRPEIDRATARSTAARLRAEKRRNERGQTNSGQNISVNKPVESMTESANDMENNEMPTIQEVVDILSHKEELAETSTTSSSTLTAGGHPTLSRRQRSERENARKRACRPRIKPIGK